MHADTGYRPGVSTLGPLLAIAMTVVLALPALGAGSLIISEFRLRGPNGAQDEFIEIYNGSIIPARGHWLCTNSAGYSLAAYPSDSALDGAIGDGSYTTDIPDNTGIAPFN